MKRILILIFVALSIGVAVALRMYREGEHDIGFMVAMALAMVVAIVIAAPKQFNALNFAEIKFTHQDQSDLIMRRSKSIRNIAAVVLLVAALIMEYLRGERNIEAIALVSFFSASIPFFIYWQIQQTKWRFENDKSLYEHQPDLQARFSMPLESKQDKSSTKED